MAFAGKLRTRRQAALNTNRTSKPVVSKTNVVCYPRTVQEQEYAKKQRERMLEYKVGALDNSGNTISRIYSRGDDFLIYEIADQKESESFRVLVDTQLEEDPNGYVRQYEKIKPELGEFRSILYKGVYDKSIKHRAAAAVSTAIRGDIDTARQIFQKINKQVHEEYESISSGRMRYVGAAFFLVCIFILISFILYVCRAGSWILHIPLVKNFLYAATFSSVGGFVSICMNLREIEFERALSSWKYSIYGAQRILLAAFFGVIAYLLIASDVLLSFLTKSPNSYLAIMAICIISGFSEKLIPNALRRLESKED